METMAADASMVGDSRQVIATSLDRQSFLKLCSFFRKYSSLAITDSDIEFNRYRLVINLSKLISVNSIIVIQLTVLA